MNLSESKEVWRKRQRELGKVHRPGSPDAVFAGCKCSPLENRGGLGARIQTLDGKETYECGFIVMLSCPLHGAPEKEVVKNA